MRFAGGYTKIKHQVLSHTNIVIKHEISEKFVCLFKNSHITDENRRKNTHNPDNLERATWVTVGYVGDH